MRTLAVVLTHLTPEQVAVSLANVRAGMPEARLAVCHGGRREDYEAIAGVPKLFTADPGLRGAPATAQSYNGVLADVWEQLVRPVPEIERIVLLEFDHVLLRADFGARLEAIAQESGAGLLGKGCGDRTQTNWWHRIRFQHDPALLAFLREISVREDPTRLCGVLGTGFLLTRAALEAFCGVAHLPEIYNELYLPTVLHHLGFALADVDVFGDLYADVRWTPPYTLEEVLRLRAAGACVVHPFKAIDAVPGLTAALT